jgi:NAD(P)-dependent dehydrogenase (short-subunit alcohol dehydrogenase family)
LLKSTKREKKFIITSTALGSQTLGGFSNTAAYGMAKAAVNNFGVRVHKDHSEKDKIVVVLVHPGQSQSQSIVRRKIAERRVLIL